MSKDTYALVTASDVIAAIERNDYGDPVPASKTEEGYWVYAWSLEQYRERASDPIQRSDGQSDP